MYTFDPPEKFPYQNGQVSISPRPFCYNRRVRPVLLAFGGVQIMAAPVFAGLAAIAAAVYFHRNMRHAGLTPERYWDLMLPLALGTIAGGVLLHFALYGGGPAANLARMLQRRRINGGAFYGNLLGAVLTALAYARWRKLPFLPLADLIGAAAPLGLTVMRLGCFQHGCCYGKPTDLPWAVTFEDPRCAVWTAYLGVPLHPTQLYEALAGGLIFLAVHYGVMRRSARPGRAFAAFLALYGAARFALEYVRASDPGLFRPLGLTTAQVISLAAVAAAAALAARKASDVPA